MTEPAKVHLWLEEKPLCGAGNAATTFDRDSLLGAVMCVACLECVHGSH